ncbi:hypothetical protein XEUV455_23140, partial [Xanthomonas euvesicatoria]
TLPSIARRSPPTARRGTWPSFAASSSLFSSSSGSRSNSARQPASIILRPRATYSKPSRSVARRRTVLTVYRASAICETRVRSRINR